MSTNTLYRRAATRSAAKAANLRREAAQLQQFLELKLKSIMQLPAGTGQVLVIVNTVDKKGEYIQIVHGYPPVPPVLGALNWRNLL